MLLADVNVLVYAFREDSPEHAEHRRWFNDMVVSREPFAVSESVLASVMRLVTNPRIFKVVTPLAEALAFAESILAQPRAVIVRPGADHWSIFTALCRSADVRGNLVTDAWLAALAIEHGCEFITTDRDFARFEGLRWRHPLH
jgi:hypothetical protein